MGRPQELTQDQRNQLLNQGFRPVEVWVPVAENDVFLKEAKRQSQLIAEADLVDDASDWIETVSETDWDRL
jgi:hypothetical protein